MSRRHPRCGLSLVEVLVVIAIIAVLLALGMAAVQSARNAAARASCSNNLRQLGIALHQYHQAYGVLPPGVSSPLPPGQPARSSPDEFPLMKWHGRVLPFIEQKDLWDLTLNAYAQDSTYLNDPPHVGLTVQVPLFLCPADGTARATFPTANSSADTFARTSYLGVAGDTWLRHDGLLYLDSSERFTDVTDGASNTLLAGERPGKIHLTFGIWYSCWGDWQTAQSTLGVREVGVMDWIRGCPYGPYQFGPGSATDLCSVFHFWSMHPGGANFLFADGSVRFIPYSAANLLPALASRSGGEATSSTE